MCRRHARNLPRLTHCGRKKNRNFRSSASACFLSSQREADEQGSVEDREPRDGECEPEGAGTGKH